jgi:hypothetical protein
MWSSSVSHVENVHLQSSNMQDVDVSQLAIVETQATTWIPHNHMSIY